MVEQMIEMEENLGCPHEHLRSKDEHVVQRRTLLTDVCGLGQNIEQGWIVGTASSGRNECILGTAPAVKATKMDDWEMRPGNPEGMFTNPQCYAALFPHLEVRTSSTMPSRPSGELRSSDAFL